MIQHIGFYSSESSACEVGFTGLEGGVWINEEMIQCNVELICGCQFLFHSEGPFHSAGKQTRRGLW